MEGPGNFFVNKFPETPEEFDRAEVIHNWMVRIDLVRWMDGMFEKYPDHPNKEKLLYYAKTMISSHDKTNYLYKIQAALNLKAQISINVAPENFYYDILLKAHQLWTTLTLQFVNIFIKTNVSFGHEYILELPKLSPSDKGREILNLIVENEFLLEIIKQLEDNLNITVSYIELYEQV